ncbi:MAG: hypothetical protein F6K40_37345, partial [Okeania sp. SIO3I5]|uniref:SdrD B-like domain-containing protein n=1 Tax=Okeania sp. SIO3I5 TaxID=2607805 RepID=UPI0013BE3B4F
DANQGSDDAADSDADANGVTPIVTLAPGENNPTIDAGIVEIPPEPASLGDKVFFDDDGDGIQDAGEDGVDGVTVTLTGGGADGDIDTVGDNTTETTTTDENGMYSFTNLNPGEEYQVTFDESTLPDGFEFTDANQGSDDAADSDADANGVTPIVTLAPGENNPTIDAGIVEIPQNPGIEIEKSTNDVDADTPELAPEIAAGDTVTWTYKVTNTGDVSFDESEVEVIDDQEGEITNIVDKINGDDDNTLDPGETWIYEQTGIAQDLSTVTNTVIDFETDGEGNDLAAGTIIDDEYQNLGVTISATEFGAMIFDSANPTGGDSDLATDTEGNILIISEDGDSSDPDDDGGGGVITFDLDNPVEFNSINLVDIEEVGGEVRTTDSDGNVTTTSIPATGDASLQTLNIDDSDVVKIEVELAGSGAISGLDFDSIGDGIYKNIGTVVADGVEDSDPSHYVNPEPDPQNPGIDIEKSTNGVDADTIEEAVAIAAGDTVTWTYEVTNTGDVSFDESEVEVIDDQEGEITNIVGKINGNDDSTLDPGETWIYEQTGIAQDLSTGTSSQDITFKLTGNSSTTGSYGNVRTFTKNGVSVDVSAFSSNKSGGNWRTAYLGAYGGGLGVTNRNESGHYHRADNGTSNDYILFEFDEAVTVDRAFLTYISNDSDISVWIGDLDGDISLLNSDILNDFTKENKNGGNGGGDRARWANFNADELTGDTLVIAAKTNDSNDAFKLKKLDISVPDETSIGNYVNIGTVTAGSVSDEDQSGYTNPEGEPEPEPENPGIDIEKSTNIVGADPADAVDADTPEQAKEIAAGQEVIWTYEVTNTGDVPFAKSEVEVTDDKEGEITDVDPTQHGNGNNILDPGETWIYTKTGIAADLTTTTSSQDIRFNLTGNSYTTGNYGNVRTFTENGVSVDVSAFSSNKSGGDWRTAYLGAYGGGLGVTNRNESGSGHRVDNGGSNDYILFEFEEEVIVDRAFLDYVDGDSDITVWIGNRDGDITDDLNSDILNDFAKENNNGGNYDRWADFNADELKGNTLVIAARTDHNHDGFKLRKLDISVPGETSNGVYENIGTVSVNGFPGITDEDWSHYVNPEFI